MYDEFGNLKKKFRAKTQQVEAGQLASGAGRAGWEVEEIGTLNFCLQKMPDNVLSKVHLPFHCSDFLLPRFFQ